MAKFGIVTIARDMATVYGILDVLEFFAGCVGFIEGDLQNISRIMFPADYADCADFFIIRFMNGSLW